MIFELLNSNDEVITKIILQNDTPATGGVSENIFYEDWRYKFRIYVPKTDVNEIVVFLDEMPVELTRTLDSDIWVSKCERHFENYFGLISITVKINEQLFRSSHYRLATRKQQDKNIETMMDEIENMQRGLLEVCFKNYSIARRKSGLYNGSTPESTIEIHNKLICMFQEQYVFFRKSTKSKISQTDRIQKLHSVNRMGLNEVVWVTQNPTVLKECIKDSNIKIRGRSFYPEQVMTQKDINTFDIYENRQILAFIRHLSEHIAKIKYIIMQYRTKAIQSLITSETMERDYDIYSNSVNRKLVLKYTKMEKELSYIQEEYQRIYHMYNDIFKLNSNTIFESPRISFTFINLFHYRTIFDNMVLWWNNYRRLNFVGESFLMRLQQLPQIYEYYCLLRLVHTIQGLGYKICNSDLQEQSGADHVLNDIYEFENELLQSKLTLFYTPKIGRVPVDNKHFDDLYVVKAESTYLTPDYLIKFEKGDKVLYGILDAKFTIEKNATKHYLPVETLKYVHGIGSTKNLHSMVFMWLLYPDFHGEKIKAVQKPLIDHIVYPSVGVYSVNPDVSQSNTSDFFKNLHDLFLTYPNKQ